MNRYHNKFHRHNHHTNPTAGDNDSQNDPIASSSDPFQGNFDLAGNLQFRNGQNTIGSDDGVVNMGCTLNVGSFLITNYNLNKLEDVDLDVTPNVNKDVLRWDSTLERWVNHANILETINDIDDVTLTGSLVDRQALIWDGTKWTNGNPYAVYADLAEKYEMLEPFRVGSIVGVSSGVGDVDLCSRKSFDKLLGVVSKKPGMLLDADLKDGTPIAYIGKVDILISGVCKKGDIIVLSKIDGVGKRAGKFDKKYKIGYAMCDSYETGISPVRCILKTM